MIRKLISERIQLGKNAKSNPEINEIRDFKGEIS